MDKRVINADFHAFHHSTLLPQHCLWFHSDFLENNGKPPASERMDFLFCANSISTCSRFQMWFTHRFRTLLKHLQSFHAHNFNSSNPFYIFDTFYSSFILLSCSYLFAYLSTLFIFIITFYYIYPLSTLTFIM